MIIYYRSHPLQEPEQSVEFSPRIFREIHHRQWISFLVLSTLLNKKLVTVRSSPQVGVLKKSLWRSPARISLCCRKKHQVIQAVTFLSPIVGGHLTIPKRSQRIARHTSPEKWTAEKKKTVQGILLSTLLYICGKFSNQHRRLGFLQPLTSTLERSTYTAMNFQKYP